MTRSSGMDSDMGDVVPEEASHPFQVSFPPCFRAAPCHRTWLGERPCSRPFRRERRAVRRSRKIGASMSSWLNREGRTWRVQWDSALALWRGQRCGAPHASKVCRFLLPLSRRFSIPLCLLCSLAASLRALLSAALATQRWM